MCISSRSIYSEGGARLLFTHANGSCPGTVFTTFCLSVYPHDISKDHQ